MHRVDYFDWESHKNEIINMYVNQKLSSNLIGKKYGCSGHTILKHLKEWNIAIRNNQELRYNSIYECDIHYFDIIDSEHKAYWVGYILADAHINNNSLMFCCSRIDIDIIYKIKNDLKCNYPIRYNSNNNPVLLITSKYIANTLLNMGFTHNKSYEFNFNSVLRCIPCEFMHHFIRGMFDGDGSIKYYNYDYVKGYQYHFGYTGLPDVCEFIAQYLNIKTNMIHESDITDTIRTANAPLIKYIYNVLYKDATIYCERKYNTFQKILELINEENKCSVKGVYLYKKSNQWMATCHMNKINKTIGYYNTKHEAEYARLKYEYDNFGYNAPQWYFFKEYNIGDI